MGDEQDRGKGQDDIEARARQMLSTTQSILGGSGGASYERGARSPLYLVKSETGGPLEPEDVPREAIAKGVGEAELASNALPSNDDINTLFNMNGALFPPYDPEVLVLLFEHSNSLRPNIDAYRTNIDAFGHQLVQVVDPESHKAREIVGDAIFLERLHQAEALGGIGTTDTSYPSDKEVDARLIEIRQLMRLEHAKLTNFFSFCTPGVSFVELREQTRTDLESTGNAYWEILRDAAGRIAQMHYIPSYSVRLGPIEHYFTDAEVNRKVSAFAYEKGTEKRRFRRFLQVVLDRIVYFKEFGDLRPISRRTGRVNASDTFTNGDGPATEILHFKIHSPRSPYGVPRWIGALLSVLGSRAMEEVNYLYFDNKAVPPMAILVSGGKLAQGATERISDYIQNNIKGKENFHKILVIEAEKHALGAGIQDNGRTKVELVPLRGAQQDDALFLNYDERNIDKVGSAFRVPRLLRGDTRDFNRATADAALSYAESQVFQPEREKFDSMINRRILADLGIRFWTLKSNSPINRDPSVLTDILVKLGDGGLITPKEGREVASDILNKELKQIAAEWVDQPMVMTLAGIIGGTEAAPGTVVPEAAPKADGAPATERALTTLAGKVMALREALSRGAQKGWERHDARKAALENEERVTITVPADVFASWVIPDDAPAG